MKAILLLLALPLGAAVAATPQLAQPGENFHGDEVVARDGERWFALVVADEKARLVQTRLKVTAVRDGLLDGPDQKSGRSVGAPALASEPLAFLRGLPLHEGQISSVTSARNTRVRSQHPISLPLAGTTTELALECPPAWDSAGRPQCRVTVSRRGLKQDIGTYLSDAISADTYDPSDVTGPVLLFGGDIDRDGTVDLLIDMSDHENASAPTLFLSGSAKPGELVHAVASQRTTGC